MNESFQNIPSEEEKKKYVFKKDEDYIILDKIHQLENLNLSSEDRKLVQFLRTQLEDDWRTPLIKLLDELLQKYK